MLEDVNGPIKNAEKRARISKRVEKISEVIIFPTAIVLLVVSGIMIVYESIIYCSTFMCAMGIFCFSVAMLLIWIGWIIISQSYARYEFTEDGIKVKYPLRTLKFIPWDEFQEVCICYDYYVSKGPRWANRAICCISKKEEKNAFGRWKTENPFRYKSVIVMDYTDELYQKIKEKCPYDIPDLRKTPAYKL